MFRNSVRMLVLMSFLSALFCSCTGDAVSPRGDRRSAGAGDAARLEDELVRSSEVQELISIRDELAARAIERDLTSDDVRSALGDARVANRLLGITADEAQSRLGRVDALLKSLNEKFPTLKDAAALASSGCEQCDVERIAASWDRFSTVLAAALAEGAQASPDASGAAGAPARGKLICKMTQLVVGMGICAARSGGNVLFYTVCAYGVFCSSCDGGMADALCFH